MAEYKSIQEVMSSIVVVVELHLMHAYFSYAILCFCLLLFFLDAISIANSS